MKAGLIFWLLYACASSTTEVEKNARGASLESTSENLLRNIESEFLPAEPNESLVIAETKEKVKNDKSRDNAVPQSNTVGIEKVDQIPKTLAPVTANGTKSERSILTDATDSPVGGEVPSLIDSHVATSSVTKPPELENTSNSSAISPTTNMNVPEKSTTDAPEVTPSGSSPQVEEVPDGTGKELETEKREAEPAGSNGEEASTLSNLTLSSQQSSTTEKVPGTPDIINPENNAIPASKSTENGTKREAMISQLDGASTTHPETENTSSTNDISTDSPSGQLDEIGLVESQNASCIISNDTQFSWLVKLVDKETKKQVCTGVLITDEDVLTPASCFLENSTTPSERFIELPKEFLAIAGGGINTDCVQIRSVTIIYPHKAYFDNSADHDYAFVKASPPFDVDEDNIPDLRYHLNVINSEGALVNIHNNEPFCESPYFIDDNVNARVSEERHLLGLRIDDCMMLWNCSADFETCLNYLHPSSHACLRPLAPRKCSSRDRGAPLICDDVFLGYLDLCDGERPLIFRGLSKAILFLELQEDHLQPPHFISTRRPR